MKTEPEFSNPEELGTRLMDTWNREVDFRVAEMAILGKEITPPGGAYSFLVQDGMGKYYSVVIMEMEEGEPL